MPRQLWDVEGFPAFWSQPKNHPAEAKKEPDSRHKCADTFSLAHRLKNSRAHLFGAVVAVAQVSCGGKVREVDIALEAATPQHD